LERPADESTHTPCVPEFSGWSDRPIGHHSPNLVCFKIEEDSRCERGEFVGLHICPATDAIRNSEGSSPVLVLLGGAFRSFFTWSGRTGENIK
jgi:hypothetical protein